MEPIKGNSLDRSCGEVKSSNCITVPISIAGVCGPNPSLTQVLVALQNCCNSATNSCYTGDWVDFQLDIPLAGSGSSLGTGFTWTINNFGGNFRGISGAGSGPENVPQYKWTKEGDLKIRGTFSFNITASVDSNFFQIPLTNIPVTCFPSTWSQSQTAIVAVDLYPANQRPGPFVRGFLTIDYPTGILYLSGSYAFGSIQPTFTHRVFMGGTTLNLS